MVPALRLNSGGEVGDSLLSRKGVSIAIAEAEDDRRQAVKQILKMSPEELMLHADFLEVYRKLRIFTKGGELLYPSVSNSPSETSPKVCFAEILGIFRRTFPNDPLSPRGDDFEKNLEATLLQGPAPEALLNLFKKGLIHENSQLMIALKLLSASILGPSAFDIRNLIYEKYPFVDLLEAWDVTVILDEQYDNHVQISVIHSRKQKAFVSEVGHHFEFDWKATIVWTSSPFDIIAGSFFREKDTFNVATDITLLTFEEEVRLRYRREIRDLVAKFIDSKNALRIIWDRPMKVQPVHKDINRLSEKIKIVHEKAGVLYDKSKNETETPGHVAVLEILTALAKYTNDLQMQEVLRTKYSEYVRQEGDLSEQLFKFFTNKSLFPDHSPVVKILKCINQEMLSPGVMTLRANIYEKFPFKDIKGGWSVLIQLSEKEYKVTHTKKEQSHDPSDTSQFTFEWIVEIPFKKTDLDRFTPTFCVSDYYIHPRFPLKARKELLDFLLPLMTDHSLFQRLIFRKPLTKTTLHEDLVTFIRKGVITVVNSDQCQDIFNKNKGGVKRERSFEQLNSTRSQPEAIRSRETSAGGEKEPMTPERQEPNKGKEKAAEDPAAREREAREREEKEKEAAEEPFWLRSVLVGTARALEDSDASITVLEQAIDRHIKGGPALPEQLKAVIREIENGSKLAKVLKASSFEVHFPVFLALRSAFSTSFPFKKVRGTSSISISISKLTDTVRIIHEQKEESSSDDPTRYFEFDWQLTLELTHKMEHLSSHVIIKGTKFGEQTSQEIKPDLVAAWLGFNAQNVHQKLDLFEDLF